MQPGFHPGQPTRVAARVYPTPPAASVVASAGPQEKLPPWELCFSDRIIRPGGPGGNPTNQDTGGRCSGGGCAERSKSPDDLIGLREPVFLLFGEEELAVGDDVELATRALDHFRVNAERLRDSGRQTGGLRQVVSHLAVADRDLHDGAIIL